MKKIVVIALGVFIFSPFAARASIVTPGTFKTNPSSPLYLHIPSINLTSSVEGVGIDKKGRMDVPSGRTNKVGWYKYGVVPGNIGTAVLDAHNTAAFKKLNQVSVGEEIYVMSSSGEWLKFKVTAAKTYSVKNLKPVTLFAPTNSRQINLITCAGTLLGNGEATHRLIVSAELV